ncbi:MAG: hypothetical protein PHQ23_05980 [Candidatus Wallbacteria bacterium]|nr:hypothetical protein [Candidatus Wallbacteria bacterium]
MSIRDEGFHINIIYQIEEDLVIDACPFCRRRQIMRIGVSERETGEGTEKGVVLLEIFKCLDCRKYFGSGRQADGSEFLWLQQTVDY